MEEFQALIFYTVQHSKFKQKKTQAETRDLFI